MYSVKMQDMSKTPDEIKEDTAAPMSLPQVTSRYPYGLCLSLDHDDLAKLEMPLDMEPGDTIHVMGFATVTSVSKRDVTGADGVSKCECRVELQITHLALEDEDQEGMGEEAV